MTITPEKRPQVLPANVHKIETGCGNMYISITRKDSKMFEVFAALGKSGQCGAAQIESTTRLVTLNLRSGVNPASIVKQLTGIRCPNQKLDNGVEVLSCGDAISKALKNEMDRVEGVKISEDNEH